MGLNSYKDLAVWQKSCELAKEVYVYCSALPKDELYGLASQMKRATVSIPSNIAEGYRRNNRGEYVQFLGIASGSAAELETQIIITQDIFGLDSTELLAQLVEVQKMLMSLKKKLDPKP